MNMVRPDAAYFKRVERWSAGAAYRHEITALLDSLALQPGARILDVGCGPGAALKELQRMQTSPVGLDIYPAWAELCTRRPVVRGDAAALPFQDQCMDAALLVHVVAHLGQPLAGLQEIRRVLRPGGRLGLLTPNAMFLRALRLRRRRPGYRPDPTVRRHYSLRRLCQDVRRAGFHILNARPWGTRALPLPADSLRERLLLVASPKEP